MRVEVQVGPLCANCSSGRSKWSDQRGSLLLPPSGKKLGPAGTAQEQEGTWREPPSDLPWEEGVLNLPLDHKSWGPGIVLSLMFFVIFF